MSTTTSQTQYVEIIPKVLELVEAQARHKVIYGGRGKGASWSIARVMLLQGMSEPMFIPCVREYQRSIQYSVKKLLDDTIEMLGWSWWYKSTKNEIVGRNGTKFVFFGMQDFTADRLKSLEGADACWVAEAQTFSRRSISILRPTIRKEGSVIWWDFNPRYDTDPVYQDFILSRRRNSAVLELNWKDNPWFTETMREEMEEDYHQDEEEADHVWGGKTANLKDSIIRKWDCVTHAPEFPPRGLGLDFGFANDPAALVRCWVRKRELWVQELFYRGGMTNQDIGYVMREEHEIDRNQIIRADSAEPKSIAEIRAQGFTCIAGEKGPDYKRAAAMWIRGRTLHIVGDSPNCQREFPQWKWDKDRFGNTLPRPADGNDHTVDAFIYGAYKKPKKVI